MVAMSKAMNKIFNKPLDRTVEMLRYGGFRWVRGGIEGLTEKGPTTLRTYLDLPLVTPRGFVPAR